MRTRTEYLPSSFRIDFRYSGDGVVKQVHWDATAALKAGVTAMVVLTLMLVGALIGLPWWMLFAFLPGMLMLTRPIWNGYAAGFASVDDVHANLADEAKQLVKALNGIRKAAELRPEGAGITERTYEFGRLAFLMLQKMADMQSVDVGRSTNTEKHRYIGLMQVDAKNLIKSGWDLADLIAANRAESIYDDAKYLGADEFNEAVNIEMMAHRALAPAPEEPSPKSKKVIPDVPLWDEKARFKARYVKDV